MTNTKKQWDAAPFIQQLTEKNKFAKSKGFVFRRVPTLGNLGDLLGRMQNTANFVVVSDMTNGTTNLHNTPRTTRTKTIFICMRYPADRPDLREARMNDIRELFRQFASRLIQEKTRLEGNMQYIDPQIRLTEVSDTIMQGLCAAYYEISVTTHLNLAFNESEWEPDTPATE